MDLPWAGALERIAQREGLTAARLRQRIKTDGSPWSVIAGHPFFAVLAATSGTDVADVCIAYMRSAARRLPVEHRLVVDILLPLRLELPGVTIAVYDAQLMDRYPHAVQVLQAAGHREATITSIRTGTHRRAAFAAFTSVLNTPSEEDVTAVSGDPEACAAYLTKEEEPGDTGKTAAVVGISAMDLVFDVAELPVHDRAIQASHFKTTPGGKGFTQAVAAARLGLNTTLVSVVGSDLWGEEILEALDRERMTLESIKRLQNSTTPTTALFRSGEDVAALGWKNWPLIYSAKVLDEPALKAVRAAEVVLVTFEFPPSIVETVLREARGNGGVTVVTPSPPYEDALLSSNAFSFIDYLVLDRGELGRLARRQTPVGEDEVIQAVAGFHAVSRACVLLLDEGGCWGFVPTPEGTVSFRIPRFQVMVYDSLGARDAFCAMLAKLVPSGQPTVRVVQQVALQATAAMALASAHSGEYQSMPTMAAVEEFVRRSTISPVPSEQTAP